MVFLALILSLCIFGVSGTLSIIGYGLIALLVLAFFLGLVD